MSCGTARKETLRLDSKVIICDRPWCSRSLKPSYPYERTPQNEVKRHCPKSLPCQPGNPHFEQSAARFRIFVGIFAILSAQNADDHCLTGGKRDGRAEVRFFAK